MAVVVSSSVGERFREAFAPQDKANGPFGADLADGWLEAASSAAKAVGLDLQRPDLGAVIRYSEEGSSTTTQYVISGRYDVKIACVGVGKVTVIVEAPAGRPTDTSIVALPCTRGGGAVSAQTTIPDADGKSASAMSRIARQPVDPPWRTAWRFPSRPVP